MARELLKFVFFLLAIFAAVLGVLRLFFVDVYAVTGVGMVPTLMPGERVFGWRAPDTIEQGDIVVCEHPREPGRFVVGRAFALSGQRIETERGVIRVNGRTLDRNLGAASAFTNPLNGHVDQVRVVEETLDVDREHLQIEPARGEVRLRATTVPAGKIFLLGDNRLTTSEDSRSFGPVTQASCRARIVMRNGAVPGAPGPEHGYFDILD